MKLEKLQKAMTRGLLSAKQRAQRRFDLVKPLLPSQITLTKIFEPNWLHTFFGYYDRSPWNLSETNLLMLTTNAPVLPSSAGNASVYLYRLGDGASEKVGDTSAWNFQQGAQQQWLSDNLVIYNDIANGQPVSKVVDISRHQVIDEFPFHTGIVDGISGVGVSYDFKSLQDHECDYGYRGLSSRPGYSDNNKCLVVYSTKSGKLLHQLDWHRVFSALRTTESESEFTWIQHAKLNPSASKVLFVARPAERSGE